MQQQKLLSRRIFLNSMAALVGTAPGFAAAETPSQSPAVKFRRDPPAVTSADQVLNVQDFEPLARAALPPAHFGHIATGADDDRNPGLCRGMAYPDLSLRRVRDARLSS